MERKQKIEILIAILVILGLIALLVWYFMRSGSPVEEPDTDTDTTQQIDQGTEPSQIDVSTLPDRPETIARAFVERFGSFSSESGYGNIEDVLVLATDSLQNRLASLAQDARSQDSDTYYGVSTTIVIMDLVENLDSQRTYVITTQREEAIDNPGNTSIRYQDIELTLVSSADTWLVSDFSWGE